MTTSTQTRFTHLNEAQHRAVHAPRNEGLTVLAGAGTGKTEVIASRYGALYQALKTAGVETPEDHLLVVTFTDKAAQEMRDRIERVLRRAGLLAEGVDLDTPWISTFHSFCLELLQREWTAFRSDVSGGGKLPQRMDPLDQRLKLKEWLGAVQAGLWPDITAALQAADLEDLPSDILSPKALAALGLEDTVAFLAELPAVLQRIKASGLSPRQFLQVATQQCVQWTDTLQALPLRDPDTQDPFASLEEAAQCWARYFTRWADPAWGAAASEPHLEAEHYKACLGPLAEWLKRDRKRNLYEPLPDAAARLDTLSDSLKLEQNLIQTVAALYAFYQYQLQQCHRWDFDDLIHESVRLLGTSPEVRDRYQQQFQAILVDEFQDTNGSQLQLLSRLMRPDAPNITVVGDEKQSIYGFRFAQKENLKLIFEGKPHQVVPLQINYRSATSILALANRFSGELTGHDTRHRLASRPDSEQSEEQRVTLTTLGEKNVESETAEKSPPIETLRQEEAERITGEIQALLQAGRYQDRDIAVLARNSAKLARLEAALARRGIASVRQKQAGFFDLPVTKDAMALLRLMANRHDDLALVRLLQRRLRPMELTRLMQGFQATWQTSPTTTEAGSPPRRSLWAYLEAENLYADFRVSFGASLEKSASLREPLPQTFRRLVETLGLQAPDAAPEEVQFQQKTQLTVFETLLVRLSQSAEGGPPQPLSEVLTLLTAYQNEPDIALPLEEDWDTLPGVRLLTAHGAKGLEFPVVFVAWTNPPPAGRGDTDRLVLFDPQYEGKAGFGLMLGKFRGKTTLKKGLYRQLWQKPREEAEEKRLFYVALTRAKERLYVYRAVQSPAWTALEG